MAVLATLHELTDDTFFPDRDPAAWLLCGTSEYRDRTALEVKATCEAEGRSFNRLSPLPYQLPRSPFAGLVSSRHAPVTAILATLVSAALGTQDDVPRGELAAHFALNAALKHHGCDATWADVAEGYAVQRFEPMLLKVLASSDTLPLTNLEGLLLALESARQARLDRSGLLNQVFFVAEPLEDLLEAARPEMHEALSFALRAASGSDQQIVLCSRSASAAAQSLQALRYPGALFCFHESA